MTINNSNFPFILRSMIEGSKYTITEVAKNSGYSPNALYNILNASDVSAEKVKTILLSSDLDVKPLFLQNYPELKNFGKFDSSRTIKDNMRIAVTHCEYSKSEIAEMIGLSSSGFSNIWKGKDIMMKHVINLCRVMQINPGSLFYFGEGYIRSETQSEINFSVDPLKAIHDLENLKTVNLNFIPIKARAGFIQDSNYDNRDEARSITLLQLPGIDYKGREIIEIDGDSMEPTLISGAKVLVSRINEADYNYMMSGVYAFVFKDIFTVKRIKDNNLVKNGTLEIHADDNKSGSMTILREDIRAVWKVEHIISSKVI